MFMFLQNLYVEALPPQCDGIWRWALGGNGLDEGLRVGPWSDEIIGRDTRELSLPLSAMLPEIMGAHSETVAPYETREEASG